MFGAQIGKKNGTELNIHKLETAKTFADVLLSKIKDQSTAVVEQLNQRIQAEFRLLGEKPEIQSNASQSDSRRKASSSKPGLKLPSWRAPSAKDIKEQTLRVSENVVMSLRAKSEHLSSALRSTLALSQNDQHHDIPESLFSSSDDEDGEDVGNQHDGNLFSVWSTNNQDHERQDPGSKQLHQNDFLGLEYSSGFLRDWEKEVTENDEETIVEKFIKVISPSGDADEALEPLDDLEWHTNRDEIRRRLALGEESPSLRAHRKALGSRVRSGKNLQICFVNETASDDSDFEEKGHHNSSPSQKPSETQKLLPSGSQASSANHEKPRELSIREALKEEGVEHLQLRLQQEAREALAQAGHMARMQVELERQRRKLQPISSLIPVPDECRGVRRLTRRILTPMNVAQLQVIVNDFHTQIENLNEDLVKLLMQRDELHMEQDSMLVDIEDLTRFLNAKGRGQKEPGSGRKVFS